MLNIHDDDPDQPLEFLFWEKMDNVPLLESLIVQGSRFRGPDFYFRSAPRFHHVELDSFCRVHLILEHLSSKRSVSNLDTKAAKICDHIRNV